MTEQISTGGDSPLGHRDGPLYDIDRLRNGMAKLSERWKNRLVPNKLNIAEQYMRGDLCIILECQIAPLWRINDVEGFAIPKGSVATVEFGERVSRFSVTSDQNEHQLFKAGNVSDWRQDGVFVRTVETVDDIERFTKAAGERLHGLQGGGNSAWQVCSVTRSYVTLTIPPLREVHLIMLAAVKAGDLPHDMVKGSPQIVNSIAYCQGDLWWGRKDNEADVHSLPIVKVTDTRIQIFPGEGYELPFQIADVMIGPFNL